VRQLLLLRQIVFKIALPAVLSLGAMWATAAEPSIVDLFVCRSHGYSDFVIPSLISTPKGTLLAFCEGRKLIGNDESPTDLVLKRSVDGGKTWLPMQVIVKAVPDSAMDPTAVIDRATGAVVLVYDLWPYTTDKGGRDYNRPSGVGRNSVTTWVMNSSDEGATWAAPVDITAMTKKPEWTKTIHGPGCGVQMRSGRIVVPACENKSDGAKNPDGVWWNFTIYSDDHGKTWQISDNEVGPGVSESQLVELVDGTLLLNMRSTRGKGCRAGATSKDGGKSWSAVFEIPELPEPVCQGCILRFTWPDDKGNKSRILFSNPATTQGRHTGTIRLSYDEGKTWPVAKVLTKDAFGYSCLTVMPDGTICCLFDGNSGNKFARFSLGWLTDGKDSWKR
jgi:sialidase-1